MLLLATKLTRSPAAVISFDLNTGAALVTESEPLVAWAKCVTEHDGSATEQLLACLLLASSSSLIDFCCFLRGFKAQSQNRSRLFPTNVKFKAKTVENIHFNQDGVPGGKARTCSCF